MNTKFSLLLLELENAFENEELDDVDSEMFQDPMLMVKWLEKGSVK